MARGAGVIVRKCRRLVAVPKRMTARAIEGVSDIAPPVIANSVPKSGTHLLLQILSALPNLRPWGLFLASQPSFTFTPVKSRVMSARIHAMANRELAGAHIHWSPSVQAAISERSAVHFFIYRDPRDVVVSEAHYLGEMNRWHRLHRHFRAIPDLQARIRLSIEGLDPSSGLEYPNIALRYGRYLGWLDDDRVCAVRYEDLTGPNCRSVVGDIARHWMARDGGRYCLETLTEHSLNAIRPEASHTFRRGGAGGWQEVMSDETKACFSRTAESLLTRLGYAGMD